MPVSSFQTCDAYKEYAALEKRPKGMKPFEIDDDGLLIASGELFCRYNVGEGQEVELCEVETKFSHTGNLRIHVKGHIKGRAVELAQLRKGTLSAEEQRRTKKFFAGIMEKHKQVEDNAGSHDSPPLSPAIETPRKGPASASPPAPKPTHRPVAPRKRDGSWNLSDMRHQFGIKGNGKCEACKQNREKRCPAEDGRCEVAAQYTDEEQSGDEDGGDPENPLQISDDNAAKGSGDDGSEDGEDGEDYEDAEDGSGGDA